MILECDKERCSEQMANLIKKVNDEIDDAEYFHIFDSSDDDCYVEFSIDSFGDVLLIFHHGDDVNKEWVFNPFASEPRKEDGIPYKQRTKYDIKQLEDPLFVDWLEDYMVLCSL